MTDAVSVLIPCFNSERFIGQTLDSVLSQTWPKIEVIVVDDGSTDNSAEVVRQYAGRGVRLIEQDNSGASAARNRAFDASRGDYIQFLDADDLIDPDKISLQMQRLSRNADCVASAEWGRFWREPREAEFTSDGTWSDHLSMDWLVRARDDGLGMLFPALWLVPRAVAARAGRWNEDLSLNDDGEYFTRVILAARQVLFCSGARCRYRSGIVGSLSGSKNWNSAFGAMRLCEDHMRAVEDSPRVRRCLSVAWQRLAHACYPHAPELAEEAIERGRALHEMTVWPDGGLVFRMLSATIGWRAARRLQVKSGRV